MYLIIKYNIKKLNLIKMKKDYKLKNLVKWNLHRFGIQMNFYYRPGRWMSDEEINQLLHDSFYINDKSKCNLNYGIFDKKNSSDSLKYLLSKLLVCLMYLDGKPIGLAYNVILAEKPKPFVHLGLLLISKNPGYNLKAIVQSSFALYLYNKFGAFYCSNISGTPAIIGSISDNCVDVWPCYKANQYHPPKKYYRDYLKILENEYIKIFFKNEKYEIDYKRFVLKTDSEGLGFTTEFRDLSRYHKAEVNTFCHYWIDYSKGEDIIQIGVTNYKSILKAKIFIHMSKYNDFIYNLKNFNKQRTKHAIF